MLQRAFVTLYLVVVLAILVAGWGLDRLYQQHSDGATLSELDSALLQWLARDAQAYPADQREAQLKRRLRELNLNARVYRMEDLAQSTFGDQLRRGEPLVLRAEGAREVYAPLAPTSLVVRIRLPEQARDGRYQLYLAGFYLILAVVIFLWVWPLVRDLRSLEQQAKGFGRKGSTGSRVELAMRSPVQQLAREFNRMQERIDELLASQREMTYAVSHELRTPLARMKFALELAEAHTPNDQLGRQLASVREDVADMDGLINQLLSYAGFEAQSQQLVLQPGAPDALSALVRAQMDRLRERAGCPEFEIDDRLPQVPVYAEWYLLERVLQNLLGNAARYASERVRVELYHQGADYVLAVEDDGPGIAARDYERVFDSFVRLQASPGKDTKGFGLGLAIVKRIIGWHGGTVAAGPGAVLSGARFECRWPAPPEGD